MTVSISEILSRESLYPLGLTWAKRVFEKNYLEKRFNEREIESQMVTWSPMSTRRIQDEDPD